MAITDQNRPVVKNYAFLAGCLVLSFLPFTIAAVAAFILFTAAWIMAGRLRKKTDDEFFVSHGVFLNRTIWIASFMAMLTTGLASVYVLALYDPSPIHECANNLMTAGSAAGQSNVAAIIAPCMGDFIEANRNVFTVGGLMAATPVVLYLVWRTTRGARQAVRGLAVEKPLSWI